MSDVPLRCNTIDPITLDVLRNVLADEVGAVLKRNRRFLKRRISEPC